MTLEQALNIIDDNANSVNDSLLDFTHERNKFDEIAFWKFYNAIRIIARKNSVENNLSRELTMKIIKSYEYFLLQIGFHFDKTDLYEMENIPHNFALYSSRLRIVVDAYIIGDIINDEVENFLNSDLENIQKLKLDS